MADLKKQSSNERYIWAIFMNAPAAECLDLYGQAQKLLVARNIIKLPRARQKKTQAEVEALYQEGKAHL